MLTRVASFAIAASVAASAASAQSIIASNPGSIAAFLRSQRLTATVKKDESGDPQIGSAFGKNANFSVYFYDCANHANCQSVEFYAGYTETRMDAVKLNEWNRSHRFGRAYIDKVGDPVVEMDIDLHGEGMSRDLFTDNFEFWKSLMDAYSHFVYAG